MTNCGLLHYILIDVKCIHWWQLLYFWFTEIAWSGSSCKNGAKTFKIGDIDIGKKLYYGID